MVLRDNHLASSKLSINRPSFFGVFLIFLFFVAAYVIRTLFIPGGSISFAYDQARDAFIVKEILSGDLKILGPSVSGIPGLFHGVLYYYFIAPFYYFGSGNPVYVAMGQSFFSTLTVFITYYFAKYLTGDRMIATLSALFFAFSFEASQYSNLLTNPSLAIWLIPLTYLFLLYWIKEKRPFAAFAGATFGFAVQSEIALLYHVLPVALIVFCFRKNLKTKDLFLFFVSLIVSLSTMILTEIKFGFNGIKGLIYLFSQSDGVSQSRGVIKIMQIYFGQVAESISNNVFPQYVITGLIIFLFAIYLSIIEFRRVRDSRSSNIKEFPITLFLLIMVAPQLPALFFGGTNMRHIMAGATVGICILTAVLIKKLFGKRLLLLTFVSSFVVFSNLTAILTYNRFGQTIFPLQTDLILNKEIDAVLYTYESSSRAPFSINTVTSPLWINTLWSYLYNWKGTAQYGYLPYWKGKDQIGQLGNNLPQGDSDLYYLIIEPTYGIPQKFINETIDEANSKSVVLEEVSFGDIIVQKRLISDKNTKTNGI